MPQCPHCHQEFTRRGLPRHRKSCRERVESAYGAHDHPPDVRKAQEILTLRQRARELYRRADQLEQELIAHYPPGTEFLRGEDSPPLILADNFSQKNTVFRPAGVRRLEIQEKK